jgi:hypothetical protein
LKKSVIPKSRKAIKLHLMKRESFTEWGKQNPAIWLHPDSSEPVKKGQNIGIKIGDHKAKPLNI